MPFLFDDFTTLFWILLGLLLLFVFIPYAFGPVLFYFTLKISRRPSLTEFYLKDRDIPRKVRDYVLATLDPLEEIGFAVLGAYFVRSIANVKSFAVLVCKEESRDLALLAVTYAESGMGVGDMQQRHLEFSTTYLDGSVIDTNNSSQMGAFPSVKGHTVRSLPWIMDPVRLYRIHQAVCERDRPDEDKAWNMKGDPLEYLRGAMIRELARQIPTGYLRLDDSGDYRPTMKGSIVVTYRNLWPFSWLARRRRRQKGEELLRELGFTLAGDERR